MWHTLSISCSTHLLVTVFNYIHANFLCASSITSLCILVIYVVVWDSTTSTVSSSFISLAGTPWSQASMSSLKMQDEGERTKENKDQICSLTYSPETMEEIIGDKKKGKKKTWVSHSHQLHFTVSHPSHPLSCICSMILLSKVTQSMYPSTDRMQARSQLA